VTTPPLLRRLLDAAHALGLAVWFAALASGAIAAMNVFPRIRELDPRLPDYAAWDPTDHWRIAAGHAMAGVFTVGDLLQVAAAVLVLASLLAGLGLAPSAMRRPVHLVRTALVLAAVALVAWQVAVAAPAMNRDLRIFHEAAAAGDPDLAAIHRADFDAAHRPAERRLAITLLLVTGALLLAAAAPLAGAPGGDAGTGGPR